MHSVGQSISHEISLRALLWSSIKVDAGANLGGCWHLSLQETKQSPPKTK
jgi:hypothetical protein